MITHEAYHRAKEMQAAGRTTQDISQALGLSRSTTAKIGRGSYPEPPPTPRCSGCRAKLKSSDCLGCQVKRQKGRGRYPRVPIPAGASAAERQRLERPLAELLPPRLAGFLDAVGIQTVNDVLHRTQPELLATPGIAHRSVKQILRALERLQFDTSKAWQALNRHRSARSSRKP